MDAIRERMVGERNLRAKKAVAFYTPSREDTLIHAAYESMALDDIGWLLSEVEKQRALRGARPVMDVPPAYYQRCPVCNGSILTSDGYLVPHTQGIRPCEGSGLTLAAAEARIVRNTAGDDPGFSLERDVCTRVIGGVPCRRCGAVKGEWCKGLIQGAARTVVHAMRARDAEALGIDLRRDIP